MLTKLAERCLIWDVFTLENTVQHQSSRCSPHDLSRFQPCKTASQEPRGESVSNVSADCEFLFAVVRGG